MPAFAAIDAEIQRVLSASFGSRVDYYAEYVDVARFADPSYVVALRDFLGHKYAKIAVDVVIATSASTFELARDSRALLFPDAAIVAIFSPAGTRVANTTGVTLDINMHGSLDLALALQPDVTQVFVVSGGSDFDRFYEDAARAEFQPYTNRLTFTYLSGLAMEELEKQIADLPERSIVVLSRAHERRWWAALVAPRCAGPRGRECECADLSLGGHRDRAWRGWWKSRYVCYFREGDRRTSGAHPQGRAG